MSNINKLYGKETKKSYYCCHKNCKICKEWKEPSNLWKTLTFFPFHCPGCNYAGYPDDFYIIAENTFVCKDCQQKYKKFKKNLLYQYQNKK